MSQHDDDWIELIAGRDVPDADAELRAEAQELRSAVQARGKLADVDEASLQRLFKRMRDEGVLGTSAEQPEKRAPAIKAGRPHRLAAVAAMAVLSVGLAVLLRPVAPPALTGGLETPRGADPDLKHATTGQAHAAAAQLQRQLAALGIQGRLVQYSDGASVEAFVPDGQRTAVNALLLPYSLALPSNGHLYIAFR